MMKTRIYRMVSLMAVVICLFCNTTVFAAGWPTAGDGNAADANQQTSTIADPNYTGNEILEGDSHQGVVGDDTGKRQDVSALIDYSTTGDIYGDQLASTIYTQYSDVIPDVDIDDVISWSNRKGFEIIKFLQTFIQPFAIIIFMLAAIFVLVGSLGNSQLATKGLWGMIASCICYAGVLYAPSILAFVVGWLAS